MSLDVATCAETGQRCSVHSADAFPLPVSVQTSEDAGEGSSSGEESDNHEVGQGIFLGVLMSHFLAREGVEFQGTFFPFSGPCRDTGGNAPPFVPHLCQRCELSTSPRKNPRLILCL